MTGKFLLAVLFTLSLAGSILGQASISISTSGSIAASPNTPSSSYSNSVAPPPPSPSSSYSNSLVPVVPAAPVNLTNEYYGCALRPDHTNHIYYLCLAWSDPTGQSVEWIVTITPNGGIPGPYITLFPEIYIGNLTADTQYTISIVGVSAQGVHSLPLTGTGPQFKTAPTDAKTAFLTKDLQNLACQNAVSNVTFRKIVNCQWGLPPTPNVQPFRIDVKARCVAIIAKNKIIRRSLKGTATTVLLPVNRAQYTCNIEIFGVYPNHKANNGHGHKFVQTCNSATGCVKVQ